MQLHELSPTKGARKRRTRVGRGIGSGKGKTAGRGTKGQLARAGKKIRPGFEGGQMPLIRRIPMRGFNNARFKKDYAIVNIRDLADFDAGTVVTPELLREKRIIKKIKDGVKLLASGEVKQALTVKVHKCSEAAREKIEAAGGKVEVI